MYVNEYVHSCQDKGQCIDDANVEYADEADKVHSINLIDKYCLKEAHCKAFSTYC